MFRLMTVAIIKLVTKNIKVKYRQLYFWLEISNLIGAVLHNIHDIKHRILCVIVYVYRH